MINSKYPQHLKLNHRNQKDPHETKVRKITGGSHAQSQFPAWVVVTVAISRTKKTSNIGKIFLSTKLMESHKITQYHCRIISTPITSITCLSMLK